MLQALKTSTEAFIQLDANWDKIFVQGTTVPTDTTTGYAKGCIFVDTDVTTGLNGVYTNNWTNTSCLFVTTTAPSLATATVSAQATTATLVAGDLSEKVITNTDAGWAITLTLPAASTLTWKYFTVTVLVAQIVNLSPVSADWIFLNGSGVDNKDLILAGTIWTSATIYSNGTNYEVVSHTSWVTKEA